MIPTANTRRIPAGSFLPLRFPMMKSKDLNPGFVVWVARDLGDGTVHNVPVEFVVVRIISRPPNQVEGEDFALISLIAAKGSDKPISICNSEIFGSRAECLDSIMAHARRRLREALAETKKFTLICGELRKYEKATAEKI
jgi:hypothetical protein